MEFKGQEPEMKSLAEMYEVTWEHEYYTDSDAAMFDTLDEAVAFSRKLAQMGKRRIEISGPGIDDDEILYF